MWSSSLTGANAIPVGCGGGGEGDSNQIHVQGGGKVSRRGKKNARNQKKGGGRLPKICHCQVTPSTDLSLYKRKLLKNCHLPQCTKTGLKTIPYLSEDGIQNLTRKQIRTQRREDRKDGIDRKHRSVVTLEEKDEQYLLSLLDEIKQSKEKEGDDGSLETTQLINQNVRNNKSEKFVDCKLSSQRQLDDELYCNLKRKEEKKYTLYQRMLDFRKELPAGRMKTSILDMIKKNQVSLISGETGCGKTTQVAQFVLDDHIQQRCGSTCHIICTQPRRISAISVAQRVASERNEKLGESCGYKIRLEGVYPRRRGSILFCTIGVLLRFMIDDPYLKNVSHVIIDEIHERDTLSDFLLIIIKAILPFRPNLRVVLMSATLNAEMFSKYFDDCPSINIPGRTHAVTEYFLEEILEKIDYEHPCMRNQQNVPRTLKGKNKKKFSKIAMFTEYVQGIASKYSERTISNLRNIDFLMVPYDLILAVVNYICKTSEEGAILIFLPGWQAISKMFTRFNQTSPYCNKHQFVIVPLHSKLPSASQKEVFDRPRSGCRKIIISTNIAETSITIDDIVFVIDLGKAKQKLYSIDLNLSSLESIWISKASVKQRTGRAGRVQEGHCYHLFTSFHHNSLDDYQIPEMKRTPLNQLCLQIKILKQGKIWEFLSKAIEPPEQTACGVAIKELQHMRALDDDENLTSLGYHLALLPVSPNIGRMLLSGSIFSCLNPVLTIAASLESKDPFIVPLGKESKGSEQKKILAGTADSDHIAIINAFDGWEAAKENGSATNYCHNNFLSWSNLDSIAGLKKQFAQLLMEIGFVKSNYPKDPQCNRNSSNMALVKAVICSGLYPNVAKIQYNKSGKKFTIHSVCDHELIEGRQLPTIAIHRKSVNHGVKDWKSQWLIYHEKMRIERLYIFDCSVISPYPLLFFGGTIRCHQERGFDTIEVDSTIKFHSSIKTAQIIIALRKELDELLKKKINNPKMSLTAGHMSQSHQEKILKAIIDLISNEKVQDQKSLDAILQAENAAVDDDDESMDVDRNGSEVLERNLKNGSETIDFSEDVTGDNFTDLTCEDEGEDGEGNHDEEDDDDDDDNDDDDDDDDDDNEEEDDVVELQKKEDTQCVITKIIDVEIPAEDGLHDIPIIDLTSDNDRTVFEEDYDYNSKPINYLYDY